MKKNHFLTVTAITIAALFAISYSNNATAKEDIAAMATTVAAVTTALFSIAPIEYSDGEQSGKYFTAAF